MVQIEQDSEAFSSQPYWIPWKTTAFFWFRVLGGLQYRIHVQKDLLHREFDLFPASFDLAWATLVHTSGMVNIFLKEFLQEFLLLHFGDSTFLAGGSLFLIF